MTILDIGTLASSFVPSTPAVPSDWTPGTRPRSTAPQSPEVDAAEEAALELATMEGYETLFWLKAPPRAEAVESLILAAHASKERRRAEAWLAYVRDEEARAWALATPSVRILRRVWGGLARLDETLGIRFPGLAVLLGTRSVVALRAGRTRKRLSAEAVKQALSPSTPESVTNQDP